MRRVRVVLAAGVLSVAAAGCQVPRGEAAPSSQAVRVEYVIDGDTLIADTRQGRERVRILGIDAPEVGHDGRDDEGGAGEATARLRELVEAGGGDVGLIVDEHASDRDRFGRLLRHIDVAGDDAAEVLVTEGWAIAWVPRSAARPDRLDDYERAEVVAREGRRGGWSTCGW